MERYETEIRDDVLYLDSDDGWLEVGPVDDICALLGGETYTIEYDDEERRVPWLETDADGTLTFDVRETLAETSYTREFVQNVESVDPEATDGEYGLRASVFADLMDAIWSSKGDLSEG